jgi:cell fate (sporulation/competence/biofilm development) regulator YlbF (YheA/YmcA/DUF963 family)
MIDMSAFFAVDLATGQEMIKSISQMQAGVNDVLQQLTGVDRVVNLGTLDEWRTIADFNRIVASDGDQSARAVLEQFRQSLDDAATAVRQGMANYAEVEASIEEQQRNTQKDIQGRVLWA